MFGLEQDDALVGLGREPTDGLGRRGVGAHRLLDDQCPDVVPLVVDGGDCVTLVCTVVRAHRDQDLDRRRGLTVADRDRREEADDFRVARDLLPAAAEQRQEDPHEHEQRQEVVDDEHDHQRPCRRPVVDRVPGDFLPQQVLCAHCARRRLLRQQDLAQGSHILRLRLPVVHREAGGGLGRGGPELGQAVFQLRPVLGPARLLTGSLHAPDRCRVHVVDGVRLALGEHRTRRLSRLQGPVHGTDQRGLGRREPVAGAAGVVDPPEGDVRRDRRESNRADDRHELPEGSTPQVEDLHQAEAFDQAEDDERPRPGSDAGEEGPEVRLVVPVGRRESRAHEDSDEGTEEHEGALRHSLEPGGLPLADLPHRLHDPLNPRHDHLPRGQERGHDPPDQHERQPADAGAHDVKQNVDEVVGCTPPTDERAERPPEDGQDERDRNREEQGLSRQILPARVLVVALGDDRPHERAHRLHEEAEHHGEADCRGQPDPEDEGRRALGDPQAGDGDAQRQRQAVEAPAPVLADPPDLVEQVDHDGGDPGHRGGQGRDAHDQVEGGDLRLDQPDHREHDRGEGHPHDRAPQADLPAEGAGLGLGGLLLGRDAVGLALPRLVGA